MGELSTGGKKGGASPQHVCRACSMPTRGLIQSPSGQGPREDDFAVCRAVSHLSLRPRPQPLLGVMLGLSFPSCEMRA